jgi:hypothetical protein
MKREVVAGVRQARVACLGEELRCSFCVRRTRLAGFTNQGESIAGNVMASIAGFAIEGDRNGLVQPDPDAVAVSRGCVEATVALTFVASPFGKSDRLGEILIDSQPSQIADVEALAGVTATGIASLSK